MRLNRGWIEPAQIIKSPNYDERPPGSIPEVLIIHSISLPPGKFGGKGVENLFTNQLDFAEDPYYAQLQRLRVSCHFFIRRDGKLIQFVNTKQRAWHCGESVCLGRARVNDFSIGIELEGLDHDRFEHAQYARLQQLTRCLQSVYNSISTDRIWGHEHIAPGRKTDPGSGFDWYAYLSSLN